MAKLLAALLAAALLALLNAANFIGAGYARYAGDRLDRPDAAGTVAAAQIASRWPPWSSAHAALDGWVRAGARDADGAQAAYLRALRLAPGDPLLWSEYALALGRLGVFDESMTAAIARAQALAPMSAAVQRSIADMGLSYWRRGTPEQRALWLKDMRRELRRNPDEFRADVLARGRLRTFCTGPAPELDETEWCDWMAAAVLRAPK